MGVTIRQRVKGAENPWYVFINYEGRRISRKVGSKNDAIKAAKLIKERLLFYEPKSNLFSIFRRKIK